MTESDNSTRHEVRELKNGYGVYAAGTSLQDELLVICKSKDNANLIKMILDYDTLNQTFSGMVVDQILDNANGNILGYVDERYKPKMILWKDNGSKSFELVLTGLGRMSKPSATELRFIDMMKATEKVVITRKLGPITLWSIIV